MGALHLQEPETYQRPIACQPFPGPPAFAHAGLPITDVPLAVLDVETTGLNPAHGHRICEVACLRIQGGQVVGLLESLVDPGRPISPGAFRVNRITPQMLAGAPLFSSVAGDLLALLDGTALVAHNAAFDLGFLSAELDIARLGLPDGPVVDTLLLARRAYHFPSNSLPALAEALALESAPAHRALGDVWTTYRLLDRILWEIERRWSVTTLGQVLDFQGGSVPYPQPRAIPLPLPLAEALDTGGLVLIRYVDARGQETERTIRPIHVMENSGQLYLAAHCYRADAPRTFRLDRIVELAQVAGK